MAAALLTAGIVIGFVVAGDLGWLPAGTAGPATPAPHLVGGAEAPLCADVIEGLSTMGALGKDLDLLELDRHLGRAEPDLRRACRPFAENCGFTIAEGAQFAVLMDDALAIELGATVHAAVVDVLVHADGYKKSISSPGVGNNITFAKAVARARRLLGEESIRRRSFVQAHGTGTPHNRTTESRILNGVARAAGIEDWPVAAVKCFVGHTMAAAGGDQLASTLGVFEPGIVPGIATIDQVAADVERSHLRISKALSVAVVFLLAGFPMPGLSTASIGELQISKSLAQNFEAHRFYSDFRYYALMDGDIPYAIVGLQKDYRIHDISWKKIDTNSAQLWHIEDLVQFFPVQGSVVYGAYILDSQN